jgi:hypothetical protein
MKSKKAIEEIVKIIIWLVFFVVAGAGVYFLLRALGVL